MGVLRQAEVMWCVERGERSVLSAVLSHCQQPHILLSTLKVIHSTVVAALDFTVGAGAWGVSMNRLTCCHW